jgi:RNA polymerase sigma-70 factor, ECF subfamily
MCTLKTNDPLGYKAAKENGKRMNCTIQNEEEIELIDAILAGDTQLFHRLILPYERCVYSLTLCYMRNREDAADVAQEAFIKAFRNLWTFRGDSKFSTWLISIALNEARNRLRRQATTRILSLDEPVREEWPMSPAVLSDWRELPSDVVERKEIRQLLQQAVAMLPTLYRQVFLLRDVEELNVNETAQVLNITTTLVKVRTHRARTMLQRFLAVKLSAIDRASVHRGDRNHANPSEEK